MTESKKIGSMNELFAYAAAVAEGKEDYYPVQIVASSLATPVRICGTDWDGRIDTRVARYVIDFQSSTDELLQDCGYDAESKEKPQVRTSIGKGSSELIPDLVNVVKYALNNMTSQQTFLLLIAGLSAITGSAFLSRILNYKSEQNTLNTHEETKRQHLNVITKLLDERQLATYEKPTRALVTKGASPNDNLMLDGETIRVDDARKMFPRQRRSEQSTSYADGEYLLTKIDYSLGEMILYLAQNGLELKAFTSQLSEEDHDLLFQEISQRQKNESLPLNILLQLNVHHTARNFKHGSVIGIAPPRPDKQHHSLADLHAKFI